MTRDQRGSLTAARVAPPPAQAKTLTEAILFVSRAAIRPLLRQELKLAGIETHFNADSLDDCVSELAQHPRALLVLDWEQGEPIVCAALRAAAGASGIESRAIFLLATEMSIPLVATAAEYFVARIHAGEISRGAVQDHLETLVDQESAEHGLRVILARAADARHRGDWQTAGHLLTELHARHPADRRVSCELAENMIHEDRWQDAKALVAQLSATQTQDLRVKHLMARCLMKEGAFAEAADLLSETRLVSPYNVDRLVDLGKALMQVDRVKDALAAFEDALALDPGHREAQHGQLQCKLMDGEVNDALALMRQITTPRELAALFNNAAILSIRFGRFDQGMSLYHTAIGALGGKDGLVARLFYNLGLAYHKQGKPDDALTAFERALRIDQGFTKARHNANFVSSLIAKRAPTDEFANVRSAERLDESIDEETLTQSEVKGA